MTTGTFHDRIAERRNGRDIVELHGRLRSRLRRAHGANAQFAIIVSTPAIHLALGYGRFDDGAGMRRSRSDLRDFCA